MDLYLSKQELAFLSFATLIWCGWLWYDSAERFINKRSVRGQREPSLASAHGGTDGRATATDNDRGG